MRNEGCMHVCLVCHTEPDVWNGGFKSIDVILPVFLEMLEGVKDSRGVMPRIVWCLTSEVVKQRPEPFLRLIEQEHEIGVHSHFPGAGGLAEHGQELNRVNLDRFENWLPELLDAITSAGFSPPITHVSWMFAFRDIMTRILAENGIEIDCSVCYGGAHNLPDGFLLADSRKRDNGKPYRPDESDHSREGNSQVVELPVSGGFGSYWEPDGKGGFSYFSPVNSDTELKKMTGIFRKRLDSLLPGETDIFHVHFHLYDFLPPVGFDKTRLDRAQMLLKTLVSDNNVYFSTPSEAVKDWLRNKGGVND